MSETEFNVEDGTPPPASTETTTQETVTAVATPPAPQAAAEPEAVDVAGQKMVPLAALQAEREQARQFKEKATQYDQVAQWYQASKPAIDFLQQNPHLMQQPSRQTTTTEPTPQQTTDPRWTQLAQKLDLYTPEGKPDTARAQEVAAMFREDAKETAHAAVRPIAEQTAREKAAINYQRALNVKTPDGRTAPKAMIDQIWRSYDVSQLADEGIASVLVYAAMGADLFNQQPQVAPPTQAPVVTESAGGRNVNRPAVTEMETRAAHIRGIAPQKWAEITAKFQPGAANTLED